MALGVTFNQKKIDTIYLGEDKPLRVYMYDRDTNEPKELSGNIVTMCIKDNVGANIEVVGVISSSAGVADFDINQLGSATLATGKQSPVFSFDDGGVIDKEPVLEYLLVVDLGC